MTKIDSAAIGYRLLPLPRLLVLAGLLMRQDSGTARFGNKKAHRHEAMGFVYLPVLSVTG